MYWSQLLPHRMIMLQDSFAENEPGSEYSLNAAMVMAPLLLQMFVNTNLKTDVRSFRKRLDL